VSNFFYSNVVIIILEVVFVRRVPYPEEHFSSTVNIIKEKIATLDKIEINYELSSFISEVSQEKMNE